MTWSMLGIANCSRAESTHYKNDLRRNCFCFFIPITWWEVSERCFHFSTIDREELFLLCRSSFFLLLTPRSIVLWCCTQFLVTANYTWLIFRSLISMFGNKSKVLHYSSKVIIRTTCFIIFHGPIFLFNAFHSNFVS